MKGVLLDPQTGDLLIVEGGMAIGESVDQIAERVLMANRGEFKEFPLLGAEVAKMRNGIPDPMWCSDTKKMLNVCGVPCSRVYIANGEIRLE